MPAVPHLTPGMVGSSALRASATIAIDAQSDSASIPVLAAGHRLGSSKLCFFRWPIMPILHAPITGMLIFSCHYANYATQAGESATG
jgi:hypothetical protein